MKKSLKLSLTLAAVTLFVANGIQAADNTSNQPQTPTMHDQESVAQHQTHSSTMHKQESTAQHQSHSSSTHDQESVAQHQSHDTSGQ